MLRRTGSTTRRAQTADRSLRHLGPRHHLERVLLVSGDRESEVQYLAEQIGIHEIYTGRTPEEKVAITREETSRAPPCSLAMGSMMRRHW
jgi:cation transport ATPase